MNYAAADVVAATFAFRNATHEERLLTYLFNDYEPVARAVMDSNQTVTVTIDFVLLRIHGLVSHTLTLITRGQGGSDRLNTKKTWARVSFQPLKVLAVSGPLYAVFAPDRT